HCLSVIQFAVHGHAENEWGASLPETLYALMLIVIVSAGAGPYSLDAVILSLMNMPCNPRAHRLFSFHAAARRQTAAIMSGPP
ncbi:MAG: hypothetical protein WAV27_27905, partial [Xanthobacteraceae bacterium]